MVDRAPEAASNNQPGQNEPNIQQETSVVTDEPMNLEDNPELAPGARARPGPRQPSAQEREAHECAGHVPYRSWCCFCVSGRGRDDAHQTSEDVHSLPTIAIDYGYLIRRSEAEAGTIASPILVWGRFSWL